MSRVTCAFLLHVSIVPEIKTAKEMISFAKKNPTLFSGQRFEYVIMFGMFKLLGGVASFVANIYLCIVSSTIDDVIKDFVAVMIISQVDNLMYGTVSGFDEASNDLRLFVKIEQLNVSDK